MSPLVFRTVNHADRRKSMGPEPREGIRKYFEKTEEKMKRDKYLIHQDGDSAPAENSIYISKSAKDTPFSKDVFHQSILEVEDWLGSRAETLMGRPRPPIIAAIYLIILGYLLQILGTLPN